MDRQQEFAAKLKQLRQVMAEARVNGLLIGAPANFSWATAGGAANVNTLSPLAVAMLLVTEDNAYILGSNIEAPRMADEEVGELEVQIEAFDWYRGEVHKAARKLVKGKIGADHRFRGFKDLSGQINPLRLCLCKAEVVRYREAGRDVGVAMGETMRSLRPGVTESEAAGRLRDLLSACGMESVVTLVAADERIAKYRHPVVTDKEVKETVMVVTCARRRGLVVACTRIVRFNKADRKLRRKHDACAFIDATMIAATRPGVVLSEILKTGIDAYRKKRFGREWKLHHQGGPAGYAPREFIVTPREKRTVREIQAIAWNPSITGTKSEDTIIAMPGRTEIISATPDWPMIDVEIEGQIVRRPDILVLK